MGLITKLAVTAEASRPPADDDFWYSNIPGSMTHTGVRVNPDVAFKTAGMYSGVKVLSETVAGLPCVLYQRREDKGKDRATDHPLFDVVRYESNEDQTAFEFWRLMMVSAVLYGTGWVQITPGPRGFADQLVPLSPARTDQRRLLNGRKVIRTIDEDGKEHILLPDEVFTIPGLSIDGVRGLGIPEVAQEAIGLAIATEQYGSRFFSQSSQPGGVLEHPGVVGEEGIKNLEKSWQRRNSGLNNAHGVVVLEEGMKYASTVMNSDDAQMIETRKLQLEEMARYLRLPPHKLGIMEHATFSNIEEQSLEFVTDSIQPWLTLIEQRIRKQLLINKNRFFAEFLLDTLLRGRATERSEVYSRYVTTGIMAPNEVRVRENMSPIDGLDEPFRPLNQGDIDNPAPGTPGVNPGPTPKAPPAAQAIAFSAARGVITKEVTVLRKISARASAEELPLEVRSFYAEHAEMVGDRMGLPPGEAHRWCTGQTLEFLNFGESVLDKWLETNRRPSRTLHWRGRNEIRTRNCCRAGVAVGDPAAEAAGDRGAASASSRRRYRL